MIVLAIDTATPQVGCALAGPDGPLGSIQVQQGRRHAETLVPAIRTLCGYCGLDVRELGAIAVDVGPGLFTGLRVGLATANALSVALGVPMVGLSSLDVLVWPLRHSDRLVAAMIDARRGEVFWALHQRGADGFHRVGEEAVGPPGDVVAALEARGEVAIAIGDGARRHAEALGHLAGVTVEWSGSAHPSPAVVAELAAPRLHTGAVAPPGTLGARYLRTADVRINWEERDRPVGAGQAGPGPG